MTSETPPQARRLPTPRWFDPRFVVGVLIVVIPIVLGAHLLAAADRFATVYVARRALVPGQHLVADDLILGRVRFDGGGGRYIAAGQPPVGYVVTRYVAAGELLPIGALTDAPTALAAERLVTVPVGMGHAPLDLLRGDVVDVYVTAKSPAGDKAGAPRLVVGGAPVDSVSGSGALSSSGTLSVVIEVPAVVVTQVVRAIEGGTLDVVRVPGVAVAALHAQPSPAPSRVPSRPVQP
ncbi:MAG: hypothetical protein ACTHK4_01035 [Mycobacteriales bacterium]